MGPRLTDTGVAFAGILFIILMISVYIKSRKLKGLEAGQALRAVRENNHAHEKARLKDAPALREFAYMLAAEKARRDEKAAKSIALGKARKEVAQLPDTDD